VQKTNRKHKSDIRLNCILISLWLFIVITLFFFTNNNYNFLFFIFIIQNYIYRFFVYVPIPSTGNIDRTYTTKNKNKTLINYRKNISPHDIRGIIIFLGGSFALCPRVYRTLVQMYHAECVRIPLQSVG